MLQTQFKGTVNVLITNTPDGFTVQGLTGPGSSTVVALADFTDEELRKAGADWTKRLLEKAAKQRDARNPQVAPRPEPVAPPAPTTLTIG